MGAPPAVRKIFEQIGELGHHLYFVTGGYITKYYKPSKVSWNAHEGVERWWLLIVRFILLVFRVFLVETI